MSSIKTNDKVSSTVPYLNKFYECCDALPSEQCASELKEIIAFSRKDKSLGNALVQNVLKIFRFRQRVLSVREMLSKKYKDRALLAEARLFAYFKTSSGRHDTSLQEAEKLCLIIIDELEDIPSTLSQAEESISINFSKESLHTVCSDLLWSGWKDYLSKTLESEASDYFRQYCAALVEICMPPQDRPNALVSWFGNDRSLDDTNTLTDAAGSVLSVSQR